MISVLFWRIVESTGSDGLPSFIHMIVGFRLLSATQGSRKGDPVRAVTCVGGLTLNCKRENIINRVVVTAVPRIFSALQTYIPPSFLNTLLIFKALLPTVVLSDKLPIALDHVIVGGGRPAALQAMVTVCPSSAINWFEETETRGAIVEKQFNNLIKETNLKIW